MAAPRYVTVPLDFVGDRARIRELVNRNTSTALAEVSMARLDWLFDRNPAGASVGWLLTLEPGADAVGTGSLVPRFMAVDGESRRCARTSLLAVDAGHRALGPALMIARRGFEEARAAGLPTVLGVAPPPTVPIFTRAGYVRVGEFTRYAKPLSVRPHLAKRVGAAAATLAWLPDLALRAAGRESWTSTGGDRFCVLPGFDARFDTLWERARLAHGYTTERTSAFLTWRFTDCPDRLPLVIHGLLSRDEQDVRGYAVSYIQDRHAFMLDLFAEPDGLAMDRVLTGVARWARAHGAEALSIWMGSTDRFTSVLTRFGFRPRQDEAKPTNILLAGYDTALIERIKTQGWYILAADNV
jgi:hypothetical protein